MQLEERIGKFMTFSEIPSNSLIWEKTEGYLPLFLLNQLYNACVSYIQGNSVKFDATMEVPCIDMHTALNEFKPFNIVEDVDTIVCNNLQKGILKPLRAHVDAEEYINKFANKYFKYRRYQLDCDYVLTAFDSELYLFANAADIEINIPYTSCTTFRATAKPNRRNYIFNEVVALKRLKQLFCDELNRLNELIYLLQKMSLEFRSTVKLDVDVDLEL